MIGELHYGQFIVLILIPLLMSVSGGALSCLRTSDELSRPALQTGSVTKRALVGLWDV